MHNRKWIPKLFIVLTFIALAPMRIAGDELQTDDDAVEQLLVTGEQPGPGLWKVSKDDHVLWILGSSSPVPKRMQWHSKEVEEVIAESQEVIGSVQVKIDIGFFRGLLLLPSALGARKNPEGKELKDVLPPDVYARWLLLKRKYIGSDRGLERFRPIFAAQRLYSKAIDRVGMTWKDPIWPRIEELAKKKKVPITIPALELPTNKAKQAIKEFSKESLNDVECLSQTMGRLESDLDALRARANAWAVGNVEAMRQMSIHEPGPVCLNAVMSATVLEKYGFKDLPQRFADIWTQAAENALARNSSTFAVLPVSVILQSQSWIERLRAKGYVVEEPS
ncbi:MAG TPA: TraB/GumN family protein [Steroidobacteraceae bacterium]|nr:TraB/GumN family protein [Steroidobacteraceae bacterium]